MRGVVITGGLVALVAGLFIIGIATGATGAALAGFCLWTPAMFSFGWAVARSGLRVRVERDASAKRDIAQSQSQRQSRLGQILGEQK